MPHDYSQEVEEHWDVGRVGRKDLTEGGEGDHFSQKNRNRERDLLSRIGRQNKGESCNEEVMLKIFYNLVVCLFSYRKQNVGFLKETDKFNLKISGGMPLPWSRHEINLAKFL